MIPKLIHVTWKTKDILDNQSEMIQLGLRKLVDLNPDWDLHISDDADVENYLKRNIPIQAYNDIKDKHIVEKSDLWRLVKLYNEGGMYVDIDRLCNIPMSQIIDNENIKWILPTCLDYDFSHDIMITEPGNPVFFEAAENNILRRHKGETNIYTLGSYTYMNAITKALIGEELGQDPGKVKFKQLRDKISETTFIKTYREHPPHDTILYKSNISLEDYEQMKRDFYTSTNTKHWTNEW